MVRDRLSDKEKAIFKLFVWVGCGCHKDLNTVLGGYIALIKFWADNGLEPPVLLPKKLNEAISISDNRSIYEPHTKAGH